jgi:hypothetical protein
MARRLSIQASILHWIAIGRDPRPKAIAHGLRVHVVTVRRVLRLMVSECVVEKDKESGGWIVCRNYTKRNGNVGPSDSNCGNTLSRGMTLGKSDGPPNKTPNEQPHG